jgi:hypothetical protein
MPQWEKGQSGNPAGKPKGAKNKDNEFIDLLKDFINRKTKTIDQIYDALPPKEKARFYADVLPYVAAKKKEVDHTHTLQAPSIFLSPAQAAPVIDITPEPPALSPMGEDADVLDTEMGLDTDDSEME